VNARLVVSREVAEAVATGRPVVALETTVVTHGLPAPLGVQTAAAMQQAVRDAGAVPALIGILEGQVRVGLTAGELERLAATPGVVKVNLGNLASTVATGHAGSTTVAATIAIAHQAGIGVMATGGIGGVHRDVSETGDVSADLTALSRFPVAVVCSGAKSVLDLPRTVEALETLGVPVYGVGTDRFPAFHRRDSGLPWTSASIASRTWPPPSVLTASWASERVCSSPIPSPRRTRCRARSTRARSPRLWPTPPAKTCADARSRRSCSSECAS
jgi:pseudouridine-5'-phosphate glycosidase